MSESNVHFVTTTSMEVVETSDFTPVTTEAEETTASTESATTVEPTPITATMEDFSTAVKSATPVDFTPVTADTEGTTTEIAEAAHVALPTHFYETCPDRAVAALDDCANQRLRVIQKNNGGAAAIQKVQRETDAAKDTLRAWFASHAAPIPATVETLRRPEHINQVLSVCGTSPDYADPIFLWIPNEKSDLQGDSSKNESLGSSSHTKTMLTTVTIHNLDGDKHITSEPIWDSALIERFQDEGNCYAVWDYLILVTTSTSGHSSETSGNAGYFRAYVLDAQPLNTAIQTVRALPHEVTESMRLFGNMPNIKSYGMGLLKDALHIVGLEESPILAQNIEFQILAAATEGARAHTLLIGPPGLGKGFVSKAAKLLQPVSTSAMPMKMTDAGLIGIASSNRTHRRPGLLPRAHTGCFSVEDANQATGAYNRRLTGALTFVMEGGTVTDASASMTTYMAQTSIILDANFTSEMRGFSRNESGLNRVVKDTGIPINLLSRTTLISQIPSDVRRQLSISKAKIKGRSAKPEQSERAEKKLRLFQVHLANMREIHRNVTIPSEVATAMAYAYEQLTAIADSLIESHPDEANTFGGFATRLGEQLDMLVKAHARLHNRGIATVDDVDGIFPFLYRKCDWLYSTILGGQMGSGIVKAGAAARRRVIKEALKAWSSATCTADQVRSAIGLDSASPATIQDDLLDLLGAPDEQGRFQVITVERPRD